MDYLRTYPAINRAPLPLTYFQQYRVAHKQTGLELAVSNIPMSMTCSRVLLSPINAAKSSPVPSDKDAALMSARRTRTYHLFPAHAAALAQESACPSTPINERHSHRATYEQH